MTMMRFLPIAAIAAAMAAPLALAGCSGGPCSVAGDNWPSKIERTPETSDTHAEVSIDRTGALQWRGMLGGEGGRRVGAEELGESVALINQVTPRPWLVVRMAEDADCPTVRRTRNQLVELPMCKQGRCVEGEVWDRSLQN